MNLDYYMSLPCNVEIIKDTDEDALENLKDVKAVWFSSALEYKDPIIAPIS